MITWKKVEVLININLFSNNMLSNWSKISFNFPRWICKWSVNESLIQWMCLIPFQSSENASGDNSYFYWNSFSKWNNSWTKAIFFTQLQHSIYVNLLHFINGKSMTTLKLTTSFTSSKSLKRQRQLLHREWFELSLYSSSW